jgi:DNA-binding beta-propeller fold protein YncE
MNMIRTSRLTQAVLLATSALGLPQFACADANEPLATGQYVTPLALPGAIQQLLNPQLSAYPNFVAGEAVRSQLSPDGTTLAILCAGQNSLYDKTGKVDSANSTQYVFLYDVSGANKQNPKLIQVLQQTNAHVGLVWAPDGKTLYAAGGNDDAVYAYAKTGGSWALFATIALGHFAPGATGADRNKGVGLGVQPNAGGLAISADGKTLVVANNYNDSISVVDTASNKVRYEHDLRPYFANNEGTTGGSGGTFPFAVVMKGNETAYVSANRDREVVVVDVSAPNAGHLITRIKLEGNPLGMTLDAAQQTLYVAQDNADLVAVIKTASNKVVDTIDTRAPEGLLGADENEHGKRGHGQRRKHFAHEQDQPRYTGASPIAVTISPDGKTLYAVNDGANSIAVIPLQARKVTGLIPTAYAPKDVTLSADGKWMYIINGKSQTGPNPGHLFGSTDRLTSSTYAGGVISTANGKAVAPVQNASYPFGKQCGTQCQADNKAAAEAARAANQYQFQLEHASLVSAAVPDTGKLKSLTRLVAENNFYDVVHSRHDQKVMNFLHDKIKHVIYVVKENRTFDQVLGDLNNGSNGDPALTVFGKAITPNHHNLASNFVTLDNFMDPGDGSMDGWSWSMAGRVTSTEGITQQINYAAVNRGLSYESEGTNRNVPVNFASSAERDAAAGVAGTTKYTDDATKANLPGGVANLLPGTGNHAATDAPFGTQKGYIFDAVLEAGLTVRNYGFLTNNIGDISVKDSTGKVSKEISDPHADGVIQVAPLNPSLVGNTDVYFRGYDQNYPDLWRYNEWKREFDQYAANGKLPSLSLVRVSHDHMGSFATALAGVNTPETQQADDDLAVGKLVEAVAHSRYARDTLIIITEDDCQDAPDHVDSHRATTYVVGPYVRRNAVVSTQYGQVNALRTIEDVLGTEHINLNTAYQAPMVDVFDIKSSAKWTYSAVASTVLMTTGLDVGSANYVAGSVILPKHGSRYWANATSRFDFSDADRVPPALFNKVVWDGLMAGKPYPAIHSAFNMAVNDDDDGR